MCERYVETSLFVGANARETALLPQLSSADLALGEMKEMERSSVP